MNTGNITNMSKTGCNDMLQDIFKIITYIVITHVLMVIVENKGDLIDDSILKKLLYGSISMVVYHFIVKKVIFDSQSSKKKKAKKVK